MSELLSVSMAVAPSSFPFHTQNYFAVLADVDDVEDVEVEDVEVTVVIDTFHVIFVCDICGRRDATIIHKGDIMGVNALAQIPCACQW